MLKPVSTGIGQLISGALKQPFIYVPKFIVKELHEYYMKLFFHFCDCNVAAS